MTHKKPDSAEAAADKFAAIVRAKPIEQDTLPDWVWKTAIRTEGKRWQQFGLGNPTQG